MQGGSLEQQGLNAGREPWTAGFVCREGTLDIRVCVQRRSPGHEGFDTERESVQQEH